MFWFKIISVLAVLTIWLAAPAIFKKNSNLNRLGAVAVSFFAVVFPLLVFLLSTFLMIDLDSKAACKHGWIDCFIYGKLVLVPMAVWASAALYAIEVLRIKNRTHPFAVIGIVSGAVISLFCTLFALIFVGVEKSFSFWPVLIPGYLAVWYSIRARQLLGHQNVSCRTRILSLIGSAPFWVGSYFLTRSTYAALPETSNGCFVVTAAGRGHRSLVGPSFEITRNGRRRQANQQLLTFWELEVRWQAHFPSGHARFRSVYNRIGPVIAARIKTSWQADAVFLALKPLEMVARWINHEHKD